MKHIICSTLHAQSHRSTFTCTSPSTLSGWIFLLEFLCAFIPLHFPPSMCVRVTKRRKTEQPKEREKKATILHATSNARITWILCALVSVVVGSLAAVEQQNQHITNHMDRNRGIARSVTLMTERKRWNLCSQ